MIATKSGPIQLQICNKLGTPTPQFGIRILLSTLRKVQSLSPCFLRIVDNGPIQDANTIIDHVVMHGRYLPSN
jgi:hypothetical protein